jgi:hypothetical protein
VVNRAAEFPGTQWLRTQPAIFVQKATRPV